MGTWEISKSWKTSKRCPLPMETLTKISVPKSEDDETSIEMYSPRKLCRLIP